MFLRVWVDLGVDVALMRRRLGNVSGFLTFNYKAL